MALNLQFRFTKLQQTLLGVAAILVFVGSCMCWNAFTRDGIARIGRIGFVINGDDAEAAGGYYVFTTWIVIIMAAAATGVRESNPIFSDALAMASLAALFAHWTRQIGVQSISPVYQPTSLFGLNGIQDLIDDTSGSTSEGLEVLLAGGILNLFGMILAVIIPVANWELAESNTLLKQACLAVAVFSGLIGVITLWAHGNLSEVFVEQQLLGLSLNDTGALDLTAVVVALFLIGLVGYLTSSRAVAAFGVIAGVPHALFGLALGLSVASRAQNDDQDAARAGGIFCWFSLIGLAGFSLLLYLDTHDPERSTRDAFVSADAGGGPPLPPMVDNSKMGQGQEPTPIGSTAQPAATNVPIDDNDDINTTINSHTSDLPSAKVGGGAQSPPYNAVHTSVGGDSVNGHDEPAAAPSNGALPAQGQPPSTDVARLDNEPEPTPAAAGVHDQAQQVLANDPSQSNNV
eukprot:TRINITY_DN1219_c0_g1_i2.p1 TRINITY_DN1219_c0_g1~~TRINITY_DN1219_c0_g1_i2.p1  ORF type:complete len:460 (+),score=121.23 TRINITY_DN1219_c0_g1_i2:63-1442(+)